jgi:hypothetical protein
MLDLDPHNFFKMLNSERSGVDPKLFGNAGCGPVYKGDGFATLAFS